MMNGCRDERSASATSGGGRAMWRAIAVLLVCGCMFSATTARAAERPNIIFLMADDMGYGDPRCYNAESKIPTPNLDKLASQGMRFTDAHTPSSVCSPTRYGVLTGRYSWRSRLKAGVLWGFSHALIEPGRETVASLLKKQGYHTGCVGKWHLGFQDGDPIDRKSQVDYAKPLTPGPVTQGFDFFFGIPASLDMEPYVFVRNDRVLELPTETIAGSKHRRQDGGGFWRGGPIAPSFKHIDVLPTITKEAVGFLDDHAANHKNQPFFLYFPLTAPHTPWLPTDEWRGKSGAGYYGDFAAQCDWVIGQIMATLDKHGLADNTLLIVTSDNGSHWPVGDIKEWGHASNGPWRGQKSDIHEGGHRVPFIVRWPGKVAAGSESNQTICHTDLMATCAAVVGFDVPRDAGEDSHNLLPAFLGKDGGKPIHEATVHHSGSGTFAIRQGDWKLVEGNLGSGGFTAPAMVKPKPGGPQGQLYNLKDDPAEATNVWEKHPDVVAKLSALLRKYRDAGRSVR